MGVGSKGKMVWAYGAMKGVGLGGWFYVWSGVLEGSRRITCSFHSHAYWEPNSFQRLPTNPTWGVRIFSPEPIVLKNKSSYNKRINQTKGRERREKRDFRSNVSINDYVASWNTDTANYRTCENGKTTYHHSSRAINSSNSRR